jgi:hypothetical protein
MCYFIDVGEVCQGDFIAFVVGAALLGDQVG